MQKSTGSISQLLHQRKYIIIFALVILVVLCTVVLYYRVRNSNPDTLKVAEEINQKCIQDSSNRCIKSLLTSFAREHTFEQSKAVLDQLQVINNRLLYCHTYAHSISIAEVEKDPQNWLRVFSYIPSTECSYGYFHGVIEGKYRIDQDFKVDPRVIDDICLGGEMKDIKTKRSCTHAFGHILLVQNEGNVQTSIEVCQKVNTKITDMCFQGVFMENIQKENLSEHGISNRPIWNEQYLKEQIDMCNTFNNFELIECWRSLKPAVMAVTFNPESAIAICKSAPNIAAAKACSRDVNGQFFVEYATNNQKLSVDLCKPFGATDSEYTTCIKDIINYVILTSYQLKANLQEEFCPLLKKEYVELCQNTVQSY